MKLKNKDEGNIAGYRFLTVWWTVAVTDQVWDVLANYTTWPTWWKGSRRAASAITSQSSRT